MISRRRMEWMLVAVLFVTMSAGAVVAQDQEQDQGNVSANVTGQSGDPSGGAQQGTQQQDPPGRVARVQYMSGEVSTQPGGVNDWVAASMNRPLTSADRVWTDKNSRAELNVGDGFLRMNSETSLTLTNVSDNMVQMELDQGVLNITVRHLQGGEIYEVDTPNFAFTVMKSGVYRFEVYPNQDQSWVTVRSGYGEATGRGNAVRVNSGMQVRFSGNNSLQHTAYSAPARDGFDDWAQIRDKRLEGSISARYVSPGVIGYQDLDDNGRWVTTPTYGAVWVPTSVPGGWAPYRYGHWAWIAPWGYTWVDDESWGFAPFHYGRWVSWGGGWGWSPGPIGYWNPYYAPALVGWLGGPGFGVGVGFGGGWGGVGIGINFGWFPLGWGEPYYPRYCGWGQGGWYRDGGWASNNYIRNVNITNTNITNINNITNNYRSSNFSNARYSYRNTPGAVTAAPRSAFTSGAAVNRVGGAVPASELSKGNMLRGVDVNPTRESVLGGRSPQTRGVPPASATRSVMTGNNRPAMRPANIESANQATAARMNNNASPANGNMGATRPATGNMGAARPATGGAMGAAQGVARPPIGSSTTGINSANRTASPGSAANGRMNSTENANGGNPARNVGGAQSAARTNVSDNQAGHYVPRPPSVGGATTSRPQMGAPPASSGSTNNMSGRNVPRPPAGNDGFARSNGNAAGAANGRVPVSSTQQNGVNGSMPTRSPQPYQPNQPQPNQPQPNRPQPNQPQANQPQPNRPQPNQRGGTPQYSTPSHPSAPANNSPGSSRGNSSNGPGAAMSAPRPPANYSYHAPPAYAASSPNGTGRAPGGYSAENSRGGYSTPNNNVNRGSQGSSPNYSSGRSYGSAPSSSAGRSNGATPNSSAGRSYGSAPANSPRSAGSYSAPRSSPSGGNYPAPSSGGSPGGGGSRAPSGGGGDGGHRGK